MEEVHKPLPSPSKSFTEEIFFLEVFICCCYQLAQWEYKARTRKWLWLHEFTSFVMTTVDFILLLSLFLI